MHYIGIDLGGTSIKGAVVTEGGAILKEASCPTQRESGPEHVAREIAGLITALAEGYDPQAIGGVGVGCPGIVEDHSGIVRYSANLHWENFVSGPAVQKYSGYTVRLANDANAAALGRGSSGLCSECGQRRDPDAWYRRRQRCGAEWKDPDGLHRRRSRAGTHGGGGRRRALRLRKKRLL